DNGCYCTYLAVYITNRIIIPVTLYSHSPFLPITPFILLQTSKIYNHTRGARVLEIDVISTYPCFAISSSGQLKIVIMTTL
ncbi:hypothetical protein L9F63_026778, partial [Diploptera punctata]